VTSWTDLFNAFTSATDGETITLAPNITIDNSASAGQHLTVPSGIALTLDLNGSTLTVDESGVSGAAGINVAGTGTSLTIADSSPTGTGHLTARGGLPGFSNGGAGIGANGAQSGTGSVTITGGTVDAYGGYQAAGIGGANYPGGTVLVTGGTVNAIGGFTAAGIGGGWSGGGGNVSITGGAVTATGTNAAAIGGGLNGGPGTLTLAGTPFGSVPPTAGTGGAAAPIAPGADTGVRYVATTAASTQFTVRFGQVLSFDPAGGTPVAAQFVDTGSTPLAPPAPTLAHNTLAGWYATSALTAPFDFAAPMATDATAYAKWTLDSFPVSFDLGGHGSPIATHTVPYGATAAAPPAPTATWYTFRGWFADATLTTPFDFSTPITAGVTLYARWVAVPATPAPASTAAPAPSPTPPMSTTPAPSPTTPAPTPTTHGTTSRSAVPQPLPPTVPGSPETPSPARTRSAEASVPPPAPQLGTPPPASPPAPAGTAPIPAPAPPAGTPPRTSALSPSFLTHSTHTVQQVADDPELLLEALGYGLVWILALISTVRLLGETLKHRYDAWTAGVRRRLPHVTRLLHAALGWMAANRIVTIGLVFLANTVIMALVEPEFGFHPEAVRVLGSTAIAIAVITIGSRFLAGLVARRFWRLQVGIRPAGWSVAIALIGLALSRALRFVPGLLEGAAVETEPRGHIAQQQMVRVEALRAWLTLVLAVAGWVASSLVTARATVSSLLIHDAFVATAVSGLGSLLIDLLPVPALIGGALWRHARPQWLALALLTATGFALVVVPQASNWIEVPGISRWLTVMVVFMVLALALVVQINRRIGHGQLHGRPELEID